MNNENNADNLSQLAKSLSKEERQDLLKKIKKEPGSGEFSSSNQKDDNKDYSLKIKSLEKEYKSYSILEKIIISLLAFLKKSSKTEIIQEKKINTLKDSVIQLKNNIIDLKHNHFNILFAEKIWHFYMSVHELKKIISPLFENSSYWENFICTTIDNELSSEQQNLKKSLYPSKELIQNGQLDENNLKNDIAKKQEHFFNTLNTHQIKICEMQFELLKKIELVAAFKYKTIIEKFNPNHTENSSYEINKLQPVPIILIANDFYRLTELLLSLEILPDDYQFFDKVKLFFKNKSNPIAQDLNNEQLDTIIKHFIQNLITLKKDIPFLSIARIIRNDIYYTPHMVSVKVAAIEIYKSFIKKELLSQWNTALIQKKENNLESQLNILLPNFHFNTLPNYNQSAHSDKLKELKITPYTKSRKLNILYHFLATTYKAKIEPVVNTIATTGIFLKEGDKKQFGLIYMDLKNIRSKIFEFDKQLSPEQTEGKRFNYLLIRQSQDPQLLIHISLFINEKDKDADNFIMTSLKYIKKAYEYFKILSSNQPENLLINLDEIKFTTFNNIKEGLGQIATIINNFIEIYNHFENK